jgi:hypothetical protein
MSGSFAIRSAPRGHVVSSGALWFGLFGAPAAWSLQLMVNYALTAHGCFPAAAPRAAPTFGGLWMVVLIISVAALGLAVAAGATAWRSWRTTSTEHPGGHEQRTRFMALAGMLLSGLFLIGVVMAGIPPLLRPACG